MTHLHPTHQKHPYQPSLNHFLKKFINLLRKIAPLTPLSTRIALAINILFQLLPLCAYLLLADHPYSSGARNIVQNLQKQTTILYTIQAVVYVVSLGCIGLFVAGTIVEQGSLSFDCVKSVMRYMPMVSRLLLFISGLLACADLWRNIFDLVLSSILLLGCTILFGNFLVKKQQSYQTSMGESLMLDASIMTSLFASSICLYWQSQPSVYLWSILVSTITLIWFNSKGHRLYHHKYMAIILQLILATRLSISTQFALIYMQSTTTHYFDIFQFSIAFVFIFIFLHLHANKLKTDIHSISYYLNTGTPKPLQLILNHIFDQVDSNNQNLSIITGLIDQHTRNQCNNSNCQFKAQTILDAIYEASYSQTNYLRQKETICKFIKCIYETILTHKKTVNTMLDYCQFITSQFQDFTSNILYVQELSLHQNIGVLQEIRLIKLKYMMKQHSVSFNKHLFGGKMQLVQILDSQLHYKDVIVLTKLFCEGNLHIWESLMNDELNMSEIKQNLKENYELIDQLTDKWKILSHFFTVKKDWFNFYLLFQIYINNQKVKNNGEPPQEYGGQEDEDDHIYVNLQNGEQLIKPSLFFHKGSAILVTTIQNNQLTFVRTSQSFTTLTLYKQQQIKHNSLNIILPKQLQARHDSLVVQGLQKGNLNFEMQYKIKNTHFVNKKQSKIPCVVFFKVYIDFESTQESCKFVCLIKRQTPLKIVRTLKQFHMDSIKSSKNKKANDIAYKSMKSLKKGGLSLNDSQNIFIKQEELQPAKQNQGVARICRVFRLFTTVMIILLVLVCVCIYYETSIQSQTTLHWNYFLNLYRAPMNLIKNYLKIALNIGNYSTNLQNAKSAFAGLSSIMNSEQTLEFIFDHNDKQTKYPAYFTSIYNKDLSYDRFDIYYMVMQSIITLSNSDRIDTTGYDFVQLNAYLKPAYDNMMNSTKLNFHYSLLSQFQKTTNNQTIFLISVILICCLFFLWFYWNLKTHCQNMDEVLKIIAQFSKQDLRGIVSYWKKIYKGFVEEQLKIEGQDADIEYFSIVSVKTMNILEHHRGATMILKQPEINLTTKEKTFVSKKVEDKYLKFKVTIFLLMILQITPIITLIVYNLLQSRKLPDLEAAGFQLFKYYPTNTILGYALSQRYYSYVKPQQNTFNPDKFRDILSNLKIIAQTDYLSKGNPNSLFNNKLKEYFFGNPCTANPDVLVSINTTLAKCMSYSNRTLTNGIIPYFRYVTPQITDYIQGRVNYTAMEMDALTGGLGLAGYYLIDAMQTWTDEFTGELKSLQNVNINFLTILAIVIVLLHVFAFECWLVSWLQKDYMLIRQIYNHLVPQQLLLREKVVRQKFKNTGILSC